MCGCSKTVSGPVIVSRSVNNIVNNAGPCDVSLESVLTIKEELISKKTALNSAFVNRRLGYIETMINYGNYCLYSLDSLRL